MYLEMYFGPIQWRDKCFCYPSRNRTRYEGRDYHVTLSSFPEKIDAYASWWLQSVREMKIYMCIYMLHDEMYSDNITVFFDHQR